jgi:hypothetical protein
MLARIIDRPFAVASVKSLQAYLDGTPASSNPSKGAPITSIPASMSAGSESDGPFS